MTTNKISKNLSILMHILMQAIYFRKKIKG